MSLFTELMTLGQVSLARWSLSEDDFIFLSVLLCFSEGAFLSRLGLRARLRTVLCLHEIARIAHRNNLFNKTMNVDSVWTSSFDDHANDRPCECVRSQLSWIAQFIASLNLEHENPTSWSTTYCVVIDDRGVLMVRFVASMRHVGNRQLVHHTHEDDAVAVRLWRALF